MLCVSGAEMYKEEVRSGIPDLMDDYVRTAMAREGCSDQQPQWFNDGHIMPQMAV